MKPAVRYRSAVVAAALLALSGVLAGLLASSRSRQPLAQRIQPAGWGISFDAPAGFLLGDPVLREFGVAIPFHESGPRGRGVECAVWRVPPVTGASVGDICRRIVEAYVGALRDRDLTESIEPRMVGPLEGVQIQHPPSAPAVAARGAMGPDRVVYVVSCAAGEGALPAGAIETFGRLCASVRPSSR